MEEAILSGCLVEELVVVYTGIRWMVLKNMTIIVWYLTNSNATEGLAATLVQRYLFHASSQDLRSMTWSFVLSRWDFGFIGLIMGGVSCGRSNLEKDTYPSGWHAAVDVTVEEHKG